MLASSKIIGDRLPKKTNIEQKSRTARFCYICAWQPMPNKLDDWSGGGNGHVSDEAFKIQTKRTMTS